MPKDYAHGIHERAIPATFGMSNSVIASLSGSADIWREGSCAFIFSGEDVFSQPAGAAAGGI